MEKTQRTEPSSLELEKVQPNPVPSNLMAVIERAAKDPTIDITKMERLLAMQERIVARHAEEEFNAAMSAAQQEMPRVKRDAKNPQTQSKYARLETLNETAIPIYTKHGFSLSFGTADCPVADNLRITCVVSHRGGHSRNYQLDLPNDCLGPKGLPSKTKVHGAGSTFSYGRRYLTLLIFNITLSDEDDDGNRGMQPKPQGPSSMAADDIEAKAVLQELWTLLKDVRGPEKNWKQANQHLFEMGIIGDMEEVQHLPAKRMREIIEEYKKNA